MKKQSRQKKRQILQLHKAARKRKILTIEMGILAGQTAVTIHRIKTQAVPIHSAGTTRQLVDDPEALAEIALAMQHDWPAIEVGQPDPAGSPPWIGALKVLEMAQQAHAAKLALCHDPEQAWQIQRKMHRITQLQAISTTLMEFSGAMRQTSERFVQFGQVLQQINFRNLKHHHRQMKPEQQYIYKGDKLTDPALKGQHCTAVKQNGKCTRGKNGNMLVMFEGGHLVNVLGRRLKKV